jgi:chloramphenicol O-acetyltransferase type A
MKIIDLENWKRREHFNYFCSLDDPYWSMVTELDCTRTRMQAKEKGYSFFLSYLHKALQAVLEVEELRLRLVNGQIVCYDEIHASATILRGDETFGCCFIEFKHDFAEFCKNAIEMIDQVRNRGGMCLEKDCQLDQIHFSSIPWNCFSGLTYARSLKPQDTVPKMTFGAISEKEGKVTFPLAIQVHHGLVDGLHVARFLENFQKLL